MSWQTTNNIVPLPKNEAHLYLVDIDKLNCQYFRLHPDEQQHADAMPIAKVRQRFINARGFLRLLLQTDQIFNKADKGKLSLADSKLRFNLAHSRQYALYALNYDDEIGVDIEAIRPIKDQMAIGKRVLSPCELSFLHDDNRAFFTLWARKEAVIKTTGEGLSAALQSISTTCEKGHILTPVQYPGHENIHLMDLPHIENFAAALAGTFGDKILRYYHYA